MNLSTTSGAPDMEREGPLLETLTRRLTDTPPEFLDAPCMGAGGGVAVAALVNDVLAMHDTSASLEDLRRFAPGSGKAERNRLALVQVACWLLADDWFVAASLTASQLLERLDKDVADLAASVSARRFVEDADHREELARVMLARLGYRPAGETVAQSTDRLTRISSVERRRLLAASRDAEARARAIREALAKKAAEEAADKWTRE